MKLDDLSMRELKGQQRALKYSINKRKSFAGWGNRLLLQYEKDYNQIQDKINQLEGLNK